MGKDWARVCRASGVVGVASRLKPCVKIVRFGRFREGESGADEGALFFCCGKSVVGEGVAKWRRFFPAPASSALGMG